MTVSIVAEVLRELKQGVTVRDCALRYAISEATVYAYRSGSRGHSTRPRGRPGLLTPVQEATAYACWSAGEATLYELAAVYCVRAETMRAILKRQLKAEG